MQGNHMIQLQFFTFGTVAGVWLKEMSIPTRGTNCRCKLEYKKQPTKGNFLSWVLGALVTTYVEPNQFIFICLVLRMKRYKFKL